MALEPSTLRLREILLAEPYLQTDKTQACRESTFCHGADWLRLPIFDWEKFMKVDSERAAFRRGHWSAWQASGLSQRAYCEEHGVSYAAFRLLEKSGEPSLQTLPGFVPAVLEQPTMTGVGGGLELSLNSGRTIVIREDFDEALLTRLVRV